MFWEYLGRVNNTKVCISPFLRHYNLSNTDIKYLRQLTSTALMSCPLPPPKQIHLNNMTFWLEQPPPTFQKNAPKPYDSFG